MTDAQAQPGWYGQPNGTERFWTGDQWSDQVRPRAAGLPPSGAPGQVTMASHPYGPPPVVRSDLVPAPPAMTAALAAPQLAYTQQGYVAVAQVAPKSPGLALLGSFFVPGLGQLMNGQGGKGVLMFFGYLFSFVLMFVLIGFITAPAIWIWSMVDAYGGAQRWNARHGILS